MGVLTQKTVKLIASADDCIQLRIRPRRIGAQQDQILGAMVSRHCAQAKRFAEIPEFVEKLDAAKADVARLYTRWEVLEALREAAGS